MARLYFSMIETVENEYAVEMEEEEVQRYLNGNKKIKQSDIEQWELEDKLEFNHLLDYIQTDYSSIQITGYEHD